MNKSLNIQVNTLGGLLLAAIKTSSSLYRRLHYTEVRYIQVTPYQFWLVFRDIVRLRCSKAAKAKISSRPLTSERAFHNGFTAVAFYFFVAACFTNALLSASELACCFLPIFTMRFFPCLNILRILRLSGAFSILLVGVCFPTFPILGNLIQSFQNSSNSRPLAALLAGPAPPHGIYIDRCISPHCSNGEKPRDYIDHALLENVTYTYVIELAWCLYWRYIGRDFFFMQVHNPDQERKEKRE